MQENLTNNNVNNNADEIDLLELFVAIFAKRRYVFKVAMVFAIISIIYSLMATCIYKSELSIMPTTQSTSGTKALLAASGLGDMLGLGGLAGTTQIDTVIGLINSPAVLDKVIDENDLLTPVDDGGFHPVKAVKNAVKSIFKNTDSTSGDEKLLRQDVREDLKDVIDAQADLKSGIITLAVKDKSPDFAVKLVNSIFNNTQLVLQSIAISPSSQKKLFLEEQIKEAAGALSRAEKALANFQKKTGIIATGNASSEVSALAALQARLLAKEIELKSALKFAKKDNPTIKSLQAEYDAIKRQFEADKSKVGQIPLSGTGLKNLPEMSLETAELLREYKFRQSVYQILLSQYENARLNESEDPMIIQKIGEPTYPERKDSPKRGKIVITSTILGGLVGMFIVAAKYLINLNSSDSETASKFEFLKEEFLSDISFGRRRRKTKIKNNSEKNSD